MTMNDLELLDHHRYKLRDDLCGVPDLMKGPSGYENEGPEWGQDHEEHMNAHRAFLKLHEEPDWNDIRDRIFMKGADEWDAGCKLFPLAEPATAQKQYARLMAAKAWLKERGK